MTGNVKGGARSQRASPARVSVECASPGTRRAYLGTCVHRAGDPVTFGEVAVPTRTCRSSWSVIYGSGWWYNTGGDDGTVPFPFRCFHSNFALVGNYSSFETVRSFAIGAL